MSFEKSGIPSINEGHMAAPKLLMIIDRKLFEQTPVQRGAAYSEKSKLRRELRKAYGNQWKKYLNIPGKQLENNIVLTF